MLAAALAPASPFLASAEQLVRMRSASAADATDLRAYLTKPPGHGPFPAAVLLHSCLGLPANHRAIEERLAGWGYVVLFVDDFATRGLKETCAVDFPQGAADAYGALLYLSKLAYVDRDRVAVVGFSQGADTALSVASSRVAAGYGLPEGLTFRVAAAFYPPCLNEDGAELRTPTLILIGAADQVTPAKDCEALAARQPGARVKLIIYPGAAHLFDDPGYAVGKRLMGMWLQYDQTAARRSSSDLREFLATELNR
jgi:dienelactone hydrolase